MSKKEETREEDTRLKEELRNADIEKFKDVIKSAFKIPRESKKPKRLPK